MKKENAFLRKIIIIFIKSNFFLFKLYTINSICVKFHGK